MFRCRNFVNRTDRLLPLHTVTADCCSLNHRHFHVATQRTYQVMVTITNLALSILSNFPNNRMNDMKWGYHHICPILIYNDNILISSRSKRWEDIEDDHNDSPISISTRFSLSSFSANSISISPSHYQTFNPLQCCTAKQSFMPISFAGSSQEDQIICLAAKESFVTRLDSDALIR